MVVSRNAALSSAVKRRSSAPISVTRWSALPSGKWKIWVFPGGDDEPEVTRHIVDRVNQGGVDLGIGNEVVVFQDQHDPGSQIGDLVEQLRHEVLGRRRLQRAQQGEGRLANAELQWLERGNHIGHEARQIIVVVVEGYPGNARLAVVADPVAYER